MPRYCRAGGPKVACTLRALSALPALGLLFVALCVLLSACDPAKRVPMGKHLLTRNTVEVSGDVDKDDLERIIKQKPNKRILGMRFHLGVYNLVDTVKMKRGIAEKTAHVDAVNERRKASGKAFKPYRKTWREWLRETVGEPPVILDTSLTARTTAQMGLYMRKEGYFHATIADTTVLHRPNGKAFRHRKAKVRYTVVPGLPYTVCQTAFAVDDARMHLYISEHWDKSLVVPGMRMDADVLDLERKRVTTWMNELGYLYFTRDLLRYDADTTVGILQADMLLRVERPYAHKARSLTGTREGTVQWLRDVTVDMSGRYRPGMPPPDTLRYEGYSILYRGKPFVRPKSLARHVFLRPGERYKLSNQDNTYRRLTSLRVFDRVDIRYDTLSSPEPDKVDALLTLSPTRTQDFLLEGAGTNRGGFLGTSISIGYKHRNVARTLGQLTMSVTLGLEAQQSVSGQEASADQSSTSVGRDVLFNTVEIGPEVNYKLPRPIFLARLYGASANARTSFTALYNFQRRPDYTRALGKLSLGQEWNLDPRVQMGAYIDANLITIPYRSQAFQDYLIQANDPILTDGYTDHFVLTLPRITCVVNSQAGKSRRNLFYNRANLELAGTVLRGIDEAVGAPTVDSLADPYYTVLFVRYAEFFKLDNDFRFYHTIHDKSNVAFRLAGGFGVPYGNLGVLPFESSFFVGGANGLRAWRARSVGPGSYRQPLDAFDRVGEVRIEGNAEYRFKLIGFLEGALFADAGNIWLLDEDPNKPGSGISDQWLSELAVGTGVGVRFNFDFFIIRFDLGLQTKDPSLPKGERWVFEPKDEYEAWRNSLGGDPYSYKPKVNFNLGIGYPF
ncbi:MAG: BamA/TamA family outer membrane protein [Flavobacteriales bacterium]